MEEVNFIILNLVRPFLPMISMVTIREFYQIRFNQGLRTSTTWVSLFTFWTSTTTGRAVQAPIILSWKIIRTKKTKSSIKVSWCTLAVKTSITIRMNPWWMITSEGRKSVTKVDCRNLTHWMTRVEPNQIQEVEDVTVISWLINKIR